MTRTIYQTAILALSLGLAGSTWAASGNAVEGKKKIEMCEGCHGIPGWKSAFPEVYHVPHLGGQHAKYIVAALQAYKKGERPHQTMQSIAAQLTDQDMLDLAAYYSGKGSGKETGKAK
jgi:cytochrome c553